MRKQVAVAILLLTAMLAVPCLAAVTRHVLRVRVLSEEGVPIYRAKVTVYRDGRLVGQRYTSREGIASFSLPEGNYTVHVEAAGYETAEQRIELLSDLDYEFRLRPIPLLPMTFVVTVSSGSSIRIQAVGADVFQANVTSGVKEGYTLTKYPNRQLAVLIVRTPGTYVLETKADYASGGKLMIYITDRRGVTQQQVVPVPAGVEVSARFTVRCVKLAPSEVQKLNKTIQKLSMEISTLAKEIREQNKKIVSELNSIESRLTGVEAKLAPLSTVAGLNIMAAAAVIAAAVIIVLAIATIPRIRVRPHTIEFEAVKQGEQPEVSAVEAQEETIRRRRRRTLAIAAALLVAAAGLAIYGYFLKQPLAVIASVFLAAGAVGVLAYRR